MTWFADDRRTWPQRIFGNILQTGPLPKHVAIIMDGNRRYARCKNIKKIEGHMSGFDKLVEALSWCFVMQVKEVSAYAFSIENFKRSEDEVNALFDLAREKFQRLLEEKDKINELKVCVRFFGNVSLLPFDLQVIVAKLVQMSKHNKNLFLNICIAYTSRDEMTMAVREISQGVKEKKIYLEDINEKLIEDCLYTNQSSPVDLLVRTSGEVRLSDFLLWQCNATNLTFVKKMWPEFSIWDFYMAILSFQLNFNLIEKLRVKQSQRIKKDIEDTCKMCVIENRKELVDKLKKEDVDDEQNLQLMAKNLATEAIDGEKMRQKSRTEQFLNYLNSKREENFLKLSLNDI